MSIQMVALRNSYDRYLRQSESRISRLREVVEKIQKGEPVDVEKALGTGEPKKEADWEERRSFRCHWTAYWMLTILRQC